MTYEEAMAYKPETKHITTDDLYMCKYATATTDNDGFTVPACTLCNGMGCEEVLRFADECCKYTPEAHDNPPLFDF